MPAPDLQALIHAIVVNDKVAFDALHTQVDLGGYGAPDMLPLVMAVRHNRMDMLDALLVVPPRPHKRGLTQAFIEALEQNNTIAQTRLQSLVSLNYALCVAAEAGRDFLVKTLMDMGAHPGVHNGAAVQQASGAGHRGLALRLLAHMEAESSTVVEAGLVVLNDGITQNDMACVRGALRYADMPRMPRTAAAKGVKMATTVGNLPAMTFLLEAMTSDYTVSERQKTIDEALGNAARHNHIDLVRHLLPLSNPNSKKGQALMYALLNDNKEMVPLLATVTDVEPVRKTLTSAAYRRWDLVNELSKHAPEDIRQKWFKKDRARFHEAQALAREEKALAQPVPESARRVRPRVRP